jgi:hypothetical protein
MTGAEARHAVLALSKHADIVKEFLGSEAPTMAKLNMVAWLGELVMHQGPLIRQVLGQIPDAD